MTSACRSKEGCRSVPRDSMNILDVGSWKQYLCTYYAQTCLSMSRESWPWLAGKCPIWPRPSGQQWPAWVHGKDDPATCFLTSVYWLNILDVELTWACQGSTGVITCFSEIVIVHDLRTCPTSCRVVPAMEPAHAQCLMAHRSKIYHLEVVQRLWSIGISLSVCPLSLQTTGFSWFLVSCTSVGPVNMPCQSGWSCLVCRVVGSIIYPGILF